MNIPGAAQTETLRVSVNTMAKIIAKAFFIIKSSFPMVDDDSYNFSYSGLKSSVINLVHNELQRGNQINQADLACSFQTAAVDEICRKVNLALKNNNVKYMVIAGGVSANNYLRKEVKKVCDKHGVKLSVPSMLYCTDNAAMIGAAAYPLFKDKNFSDLSINAKSHSNIY